MRTFTIPAYERKDPEQVSSSVWILIYNAMGNFPAGNVEQTKNGGEVMATLDAISIQEYNEDDDGNKTPKTKYLNPEGGRIDLQDAAFLLMEKAIKDFRNSTDRAGKPQVTMSSWKTLKMYDELIAGAASYQAGEVPPGLDADVSEESAAIKED